MGVGKAASRLVDNNPTYTYWCLLLLVYLYVQDVVECQLTTGQVPPETAGALQQMAVELRQADIRQKVGGCCGSGRHSHWMARPLAYLDLGGSRAACTRACYATLCPSSSSL